MLRRSRPLATLVPTLALLLPSAAALTGCADDSGDAAGNIQDGGDGAEAEGGGFDDGAADGGGMGADSGPAGDDGGDGLPGDEGGGDDGGAAGDDAGDGGDAGGGADGSDEPGKLTAAEWNDLANWDFWLGLMANEDDAKWSAFEAEWGFDVSATRIPVVAMAGEDVIADAAVSLLDGQGQTLWDARTDAHGNAEVFAWSSTDAEVVMPLSVRVASQAVSTTIEIAADPEEMLELGLHRSVIELDVEPPAPNAVDLMFVVDTTGSMGDELDFLQTELADVIDNVRSEAEQAFDLRLSVNFYRDEGDDYVVRSFPFTDDVDAALAQLAEQSSGGGGDFPEAMAEALTDAVFDHQWTPEARARLLFLVLDAPPHQSADRLEAIERATREAAKQGIRIIPVAGSGINKSTEFLSRMLDIATGGTYVFLTDDSGIGGAHLEPTVGDYQVELLNDLLTRLVSGATKLGALE